MSNLENKNLILKIEKLPLKILLLITPISLLDLMNLKLK
jgi:hypothetical protein